MQLDPKDLKVNFDEVKDEVEKILDADDILDDIEASIRDIAKIQGKIHSIYFREGQKLARQESAFSHLKMYRWKYYSHKLPATAYNQEPLNITVGPRDVGKYMEADSRIREFNLIINDQRMVLKMVEDGLRSIKSRGRELGTVVEYRRLMM